MERIFRYMKVSNRNNDRKDAAEIASEDPSIFKLRADEFHEIFDLLTLDELITVGETCTRLQTYAGDFYRSNYKEKAVNFEQEPRLKIFSKFIPTIRIYSQFRSRFKSRIGTPARFVETNCKSLTKLFVGRTKLTPETIGNLKPFMHQIEGVEMKRPADKFQHKFLKMFPKLKRLSFMEDDTNGVRHRRIYRRILYVKRFILRNVPYAANITGNHNVWLQKYPTLEHLEFRVCRFHQPTNGIATFLERNPNIRSFATDDRFLWNNQQAFKESQIKLDDLTVRCGYYSIVDVVSLLHELYSKGFYKRLHVYEPKWPMDCISKLNGLKTLILWELNDDYLQGFKLFNSVELKEFGLIRYKSVSSTDDMENLAIGLINLERLSVYECYYNQILPFIRHSRYLKMISIGEQVDGVLDLKAWNEERKKRIEEDSGSNVRKLIVFLQKESYLSIKWANKEINLDYIELRRSESYEWGYNSSQCEGYF